MLKRPKLSREKNRIPVDSAGAKLRIRIPKAFSWDPDLGHYNFYDGIIKKFALCIMNNELFDEKPV